MCPVPGKERPAALRCLCGPWLEVHERAGDWARSAPCACYFPVPGEAIVDVPPCHGDAGLLTLSHASPRGYAEGVTASLAKKPKCKPMNLGVQHSKSAVLSASFRCPVFLEEEWRAYFNNTNWVLPPPPQFIRYRNS